MTCLFTAGFIPSALARHSLTWQELREKFEATNPTLQAARIGIDESRAQEVKAYLRPNPDAVMTVDQINPFSTNLYRPFTNTLPFFSGSYLRECEHKRELRRESAQKATAAAILQLGDQERTLLFNLRAAFVQTLQQEAILDVTKENSSHLDWLELQRVQFESDAQDLAPVDQFDVTGTFDFTDRLAPLEEYRSMAQQNYRGIRLNYLNVVGSNGWGGRRLND